MRQRFRAAVARAGAILAALAVTASAGYAEAATISQCDFSSASGLVLNGSAAQSGSLLHLTSAARDESGTVFYGTAVPWTATTSFHTSFQVQIAPSSAGLSEGLAFVLQASGADALGGDSFDLGYSGIAPSLEIELDTYQDSFDPDGNHVALMNGGDPEDHLAFADPPFAMAGGGVLYGWVDYDASSTELDVYLSQAALKPAAPLLTTDVVLASVSSVFAGFSSATGADTLSDQSVLAWELSTDGVPCACGGDADCGGATPVCAPASSPRAGLCVSSTPPAVDAGSPPALDAGASDASADAAIPGVDAGAPTDAQAVAPLDAGTHPDASATAHADAAAPPASGPPVAQEVGRLAGGGCAVVPAGGSFSGGGALPGLLALWSLSKLRRRSPRR